MIGKVLRSGGSTGGLIRYLFGRGRNGEHVAPRLVAGWDDPATLEPPGLDSGGRDLHGLVGLLDAPARAGGYRETDRPIYHVILSSARAGGGLPADRPLTDAEWASVAEDAMRRVGLAGRGPGRDAHWVAVRHDQPGAEHVHIVATLAAEDGRRLYPRNDFYRLGEACHAAEARYELRETAPRDRTATPRATRPETDRARRTGAEPARSTLRREVRAAVGAATSVDGFLGQLRVAGLLVRERYSERDGTLTGYAVALPGRKDAGGAPVYFGGGRLASDLTLPKLRARWEPEPVRAPGGEQPSPQPATRPTLTPEERKAVWRRAVEAARTATETIRDHAADPAGAAEAAWAASDFLASAARLVDGQRGGALAAAAAEYDRAAREAWGRTPPPTAAGAGLRAAGGLLMAARVVMHADTRQLLQLLAQLAALSDAVTRMREAQQRAVQAGAARLAAEQFRTLRDRQQATAPGRAAAAGIDIDDRLADLTQTPAATGRGVHR